MNEGSIKGKGNFKCIVQNTLTCSISLFNGIF